MMARLVPGLFALLLALSLLFGTRDAHAQRVVLLRPGGADPILSEAFSRLRGELSAQDFEVLVVDADSASSGPSALVKLTKEQRAFAGISLRRGASTATADVYIADRITGKLSQRTLALSDAREAPSVLAVRAVDLLRSSLRELGDDEQIAPEVVGVDRSPVPTAVRDWAAEPPSRFRLGAAALVFVASPALGVALGPSVSLRARLAKRFSLGAIASGPLLGARFDAASGSASVRQEFGLVEMVWSALMLRRLELGPSLFFGAYHLEAKGEVDPPLVSQSDTVWSLALGGGLGAGVRLSEHLLLEGSARVFSLSPRPGVAIFNDETEFARLCAALNLGVGAEF